MKLCKNYSTDVEELVSRLRSSPLYSNIIKHATLAPIGLQLDMSMTPLLTGHVIRRMRSGRVRIFNGNQWETL